MVPVEGFVQWCMQWGSLLSHGGVDDSCQAIEDESCQLYLGRLFLRRSVACDLLDYKIYSIQASSLKLNRESVLLCNRYPMYFYPMLLLSAHRVTQTPGKFPYRCRIDSLPDRWTIQDAGKLLSMASATPVA